MGRQIVYCQVCGERILESDLEAGRALSVSGHNFCANCRAQAPSHLGEAAPTAPPIPSHDPPTPRRSTPSSGKLPHARPHTSMGPAPSSSKGNTGIIAGIVVGALLIVVVVFVAMSGRGNPPADHGKKDPVDRTRTNETRITTDDPSKAARETYEKLKDFAARNGSDPQAVIARIQEDLPRLSGTLFDSDARLLLKEMERASDQKKLATIVDDLLKKVADTEKSDPQYERRNKVQTWFRETRQLVASSTALSLKLDEAEQAFSRRFTDAAAAAARPLLEQANRQAQDKKYDDAVATLERLPATFAETPSGREADRLKEEYRRLKADATVASGTVQEFQRALQLLNANINSQETWEEAARVLQKCVKDVHDPEVLRREGITQREQINVYVGGNYYLAWHWCRWRKDLDTTFKHLDVAFKGGFNNWDDAERTPFLAEARKDPRWEKLVTSAKKLADPNRRRLGFQGQVLTAEECAAAKLGAKEGGLSVREVLKGVAQNAGLQAGDCVVGFNGKKLGREDPFEDLRTALEAVTPGKDFDLEIVRDGARKTLKARWEK